MIGRTLRPPHRDRLVREQEGKVGETTIAPEWPPASLHKVFGETPVAKIDEKKARDKRLAYELTQAREPDADEMVRAGMFLGRYREKLASLGGKSQAEQEQAAWAAFSRVLLTSNGFLFVD